MRLGPVVAALVIFPGLAAPTASAFAADLPSRVEPPVFTQPAAEGFDVTIGAGPQIINRFPGAKQVTVLPVFNFDYRKAGTPERFYTPDDSFGIGILNTQYFRAGPAANYIQNRGLGGGFNGLHTIGGTVEVGGFAEVYPIPGHMRIRGEILQGVTGSKGLVGNLGADGFQRFGPVVLSLGPRIGFGNDRYASQYFSVTPFEAASNGLVTPYQARGGLTSVGGLGTVRYDLSAHYYALLFGGYSRLVDSVGRSPIPVKLGDRNQFTAGLTLNYTFGFRGLGRFGY